MRAGAAVVVGLVLAGGAWALLSARASRRPEREEAGDAGPAKPGAAPGLSTRPPSRGAGAGPARRLRRVAGAASIHGAVTRGKDPVAATVDVFGGGDRPLDSLVPSSALRLADFFPADDDVPAARVASAEARVDGGFRIADLPTGSYVLRATAADGARGFAFAKVKGHDDDVEANVEVAAGAHTLVGRVLDGERPWNGSVAVVRGIPDSLAEGVNRMAVEPVTDGRFTARALEAGLHLVAALDAQGGVLAAAVAVVPAPSEWVLRLGTAFDTGLYVVAKATGAPIRGAEGLCYATEADAVLATAKSDADGRISLPALSGCLWRISAPGFVTLLAEPLEETGRRFALEAAARIEGRVTSLGDGVAVPGVLVRSRPIATALAIAPGSQGNPGPFALDPSSLTDAEGRYFLDGVAAGDQELYATAAGWISKGLGSEEAAGYVPNAVRAEAGVTQIVNLTVVRTATLSGRVLGARGEPVVGRVVTCEGEGDGWVGSYRVDPAVEVVARDRSLRTDALGRFRFDGLVPGLAVTLDVAEPADGADGRISRTRGGDAAGPFLPGPGESLEVEIRLLVPRRLDVAVVDDSDPPRPFPGVRVLVEEADHGGYRYEMRRRTEEAETTDAEGRASFLLAPGGLLTVHAEMPDGAWRLGGGVNVPESTGPSARLTVKVVLSRGPAIEGRVVTTDGSPVARERVSAQAALFGWADTTTDDQGRFRLEGLVAGAWVLRVYTSEGVAYARVEAGATDVTLTLAPEAEEDEAPETRPVVVRVLSPTGEPVPGATVARVDGDDDRENERGPGNHIEMRSTEATGWYFATGVGAGGTTAFGPALAGPVDPHDREVVLRLSAARRLTGVVVDEARAPVPGAALRLRRLLPKGIAADVWSDAGRARADASGRFEFDGLGAFAHEVTVTGPAHLAAARTLPVPADGEMRIVLSPAAQVRGVVRTSAGAPVPQARVWARLAGDTYFAPAASATTDAAGRFHLERLPKGPVVFGAAPEGGHYELMSQRDRTIEVGRGGEIEIVLPPTADLVVRVEQAPVWPAQLVVDGTSIAVGGVIQTAGGHIRFTDLPTDLTYTLWAPLGDRAAYKSGLRAGAPVVTLPSEPLGEIRGRIVTPPGFVEFRVSASKGGFRLYGSVDVGGGFRLGGLPPGSWEVTAEANRGTWTSKISAKTTAEPGATLEIVLRPR